MQVGRYTTYQQDGDSVLDVIGGRMGGLGLNECEGRGMGVFAFGVWRVSMRIVA